MNEVASQQPPNQNGKKMRRTLAVSSHLLDLLAVVVTADARLDLGGRLGARRVLRGGTTLALALALGLALGLALALALALALVLALALRLVLALTALVLATLGLGLATLVLALRLGSLALRNGTRIEIGTAASVKSKQATPKKNPELPSHSHAHTLPLAALLFC